MYHQLLVISGACLVATPAFAGDLERALEYTKTPGEADPGTGDIARTLAYTSEKVNDELVSNYGGQMEEDKDTYIPIFISRDVMDRGSPDSYDCSSTLIDDKGTLRTSTEDRWAHRQCLYERFNRDSLPGFQTLGTLRLSARRIEPWTQQAEARTAVPAQMLDAIVMYSSGYRPGVISDDGHIGLMQLKPELLEQVGISATPRQLLDPQQNILIGAEYLKRSVEVHKSFLKGLASYKVGPEVVKNTPGGLPKIPEVIWFVREMFVLYYGKVRPFPTEIAAESMAFVWTWLE